MGKNEAMSHEPRHDGRGRARLVNRPVLFSVCVIKARRAQVGRGSDARTYNLSSPTAQPALQPRLRIVSLPCSPLPSIPLFTLQAAAFHSWPHASPPPPSYSLPSPSQPSPAPLLLARFPTSGLPTDHCPPCAPYGRTRISCSARPKCKLIDASFQGNARKVRTHYSQKI